MDPQLALRVMIRLLYHYPVLAQRNIRIKYAARGIYNRVIVTRNYLCVRILRYYENARTTVNHLHLVKFE